jgi:hypothetical protein
MQVQFGDLAKRLRELTEKLKVTTNHAERATLLRQFREVLAQAEQFSASILEFHWNKAGLS